MRVPLFLADHHVAFETLVHAPAYTAHRLARYLGVPGGQVVKGVLLKGTEGFFVAVLSATHRVQTATLERLLGGTVRLANCDEVAETFRDCEWGVSSPFGTLYGLTTILDAALVSAAPIVFEAHSHLEAIRMRCADYERLERPRRLRFATRVTDAPARR